MNKIVIIGDGWRQEIAPEPGMQLHLKVQEGSLLILESVEGARDRHLGRAYAPGVWQQAWVESKEEDDVS